MQLSAKENLVISFNTCVQRYSVINFKHLNALYFRMEGVDAAVSFNLVVQNRVDGLPVYGMVVYMPRKDTWGGNSPSSFLLTTPVSGIHVHMHAHA